MAETPPALLAAALRRDPAGPLITYYDDASGERTELSAATTANWVAKSANLLSDDLDLAAGDAVCVLLPAHWQTAVVLLATWSVGALPQTELAASALVIADEPSLPAVLAAGASAVLGLSLAPMNAPLSSPPPEVVDYAAEVLGHGDVFSAVSPSGGDAAEGARSWGAGVGLTSRDRLLVAGAGGLADVAHWLLAPLCAHASLVLCRHTDPLRLAKRAADERVSATLGATVAGIRRLDGG